MVIRNRMWLITTYIAVAVALGGALAAYVLSTAGPAPRLTNAQLQSESLRISKEIMVFINERQAKMPRISFDDWDASLERTSRYDRETINLYYRDFGAEVALLGDEFARRGLKDKELEDYADNPTNYIGLRILAMRLGALATRLEVETTEGAR